MVANGGRDHNEYIDDENYDEDFNEESQKSPKQRKENQSFNKGNIPGRIRDFNNSGNKLKMIGNSLPLGDSKAGTAAQKAVKLANFATKTAARVKGAASGLVSTLTNPVFWIGLLIVIVVASLIIGVFSFVQTIGKNDNADGCYGVGASNSSTIVFQEDDDENARADKMVTWLLSQPAWEVNDGKPLIKEQAFAIVGNFLAESRMEPHTIEMSAPNWEQYMGADNDVIWQWTRDLTAVDINVGLGLAQWTWNPGRSGALIDKARETNTKWYEIQPQLELLQDEMNGAYANPLKGGGFTDSSGKSIEEMSVIFHDIFEGSADSSEMKKRRGEAARKVSEQYVGGSATGGRSGGSCTRGSSADMSSSIALAISIAYRPDEAHKGITSDGKGRNVAKPEYIEAKEMAMEKNFDDLQGGELYASCDRVVATILKNTLDPEIPWGNVAAQEAYFDSTPEKYQEIMTPEETQPGDIFLINQGAGNEHIVFYIGDYEGTDSIVQGSWNTEVAIIKNAYVKQDMGAGRYRAFRFIGDASRTDLAGLD